MYFYLVCLLSFCTRVNIKTFIFFLQILSASMWGGLLLPLGEKPTCIADRYRNALRQTINFTNVEATLDFNGISTPEVFRQNQHHFSLPFSPKLSTFFSKFACCYVFWIYYLQFLHTQVDLKMNKIVLSRHWQTVSKASSVFNWISSIFLLRHAWWGIHLLWRVVSLESESHQV